MSILIDNPDIEARLNAFATARGMAPDEALAVLLASALPPSPLPEVPSSSLFDQIEATLGDVWARVPPEQRGRGPTFSTHEAACDLR